MDAGFEVFDYKRIFFGDAPILFLAEIVFRTVIMYTYTIFLVRVLGKRGMGQFSGLELAIIICFGSAVGDPMIGADIPIIHGVAGITTVAFLQLGLEKVINRNKKLEKLMEGEPRLIVDNGIILPAMFILSESEIPENAISRCGETCCSAGDCSCRNCGYTSYIKKGIPIASCQKCGYETWLNNTVCNASSTK